MEPIQPPSSNIDAPDEVVAQSIAADSGWRMEAGAVYDEGGIWIAPSLTEAAKAMREENWLVPADAEASGPQWQKIPPVAERADRLRSRLRRP